LGARCQLMLYVLSGRAQLGNAVAKDVLIRGGTYLEEAGRCDTVIIDKTRTVMLDRPRVVE
jgi:cation-transporting P-type ATPase C